MIQKKIKKRKNVGIFLVAAGIFSLAFITSSAGAQEMSPVSASSVGADKILGTPVGEIISAASSGGLSGAQNFSALKQSSQEQTFESSIPADPQPSSQQLSDPQPSPAFDSNSLKELESQGGLSSAPQADSANTPTVFNLAVKFFEGVVFKKDVEFASRPMFDKGLDISGQPTFNKDTAGYAIIGKGNQSVEVDFDSEYDSPPVVTATLSLQQYKDPDVRAVAEDLLLVSDVKYIIANVSTKSFEIMMDHKADSDIPFSWHALAVDDPATSKKKGEKLNSKVGTDLSTDNFAASPSSTAAGTDSAASNPAPASQPPNIPSANGNAGSN